MGLARQGRSYVVEAFALAVTNYVERRNKCMTCVLSKTLEVLDEKLKDLEQTIKDCREEAKEAKKEMADIKRLLKELKPKQSKKEEKLISQQGYWY